MMKIDQSGQSLGLGSPTNFVVTLFNRGTVRTLWSVRIVLGLRLYLLMRSMIALAIVAEKQINWRSVERC